MLGLAVVYSDKPLFEKIANQLGAAAIKPFSSQFDQCKIDYDPKAKKLLELTLRACLVVGDNRLTNLVLLFAKHHNYLLAIDE